MENHNLSLSVTITSYREFEAQKNQAAIADFIDKRFTERYITPLRVNSDKKHGFCTMAICCLMIEALESFWQGWVNTNNRSRDAFCSFFERCAGLNSPLSIFSQEADDFYKGIRCGILHQAETTNGWRIRRDGPLYNPENKTINATMFHKELENVLSLYCDKLRDSDWGSDVWQKLRNKMEAVIKNCSAQTK